LRCEEIERENSSKMSNLPELLPQESDEASGSFSEVSNGLGSETEKLAKNPPKI
jgi:hypothetical protein